MGNRVYYHHPDDNQYSLAFVTDDRSKITHADEDAKIEQYVFDEEFFVLYTDGGPSGYVDEDVTQISTEIVAQLPPDDRIITLRYLRLFQEVVKKKERDEGVPPKMYKGRDDEEIAAALEHVNWGTIATDVAGELMSSLVLKHPLPNANHRTAISMASWYLKSARSEFSLPELATEDYRWKEWVDEYIVESKRLLTVRRNTTAFRMLQEWGCDTIVRKGNVLIDLSEYQLEVPESEAFEIYAREHTELCMEFMRETATRAGYDELSRIDGPTKREFADFLRDAE